MLTILGEECKIDTNGKYPNGRLAVRILSVNGGPMMTLSTNIPEENLEDGEFFVKTWSENAPYIKDIFSTGKFESIREQAGTLVWKMKGGD